jgi:hypothetical protein
MVSYYFTHLVGAIGIGCNPSNEIAVPSSYFFPVCEIPWSRNVSCVDGVPDDDIESLFS